MTVVRRELTCSARLPDGGQLPSGRHGLDPVAVRRHQRERVLDAAAAIALRRGYEAATVTEIIRRAQLSRKTFYQLFESRAAAIVTAFTNPDRCNTEPAPEFDPSVVLRTGIPELDDAGYRIVRAPAAALAEVDA